MTTQMDIRSTGSSEGQFGLVWRHEVVTRTARQLLGRVQACIEPQIIRIMQASTVREVGDVTSMVGGAMLPRKSSIDSVVPKLTRAAR